MASSRNSKSKSSGLRILWIPGRRKSHPKGRYDATNKQVAYSTKQKNNEMWSLGGNKAQTDIIKADPVDTPSVSGVTPAICAIGAAAGAASAIATEKCPTAAVDDIKDTNLTTAQIAVAAADDGTGTGTPQSPSSTASTEPLLSPSHSPQPPALTTTQTEFNNMPTKTMPSTPAIITTTTTVEIIEENRFAALREKELPDDFDANELPLPPKGESNMINSTPDRTALVVTSQPKSTTVPVLENGERTGTTKKTSHHRNHNNNHQSDVNSIESISENVNIPSDDMAWIDDLMLARQSKDEKLTKSKRKKEKKLGAVKELDQLDGVHNKMNAEASVHEDDEKLVKCLYYSLMCCDCSIS